MHKYVLDKEWKLKQSDEELKKDEVQLSDILSAQEDWIKAEVPGDIHNDLYQAGEIPDPYYGDNFKECQWVTEEDWFYYKTFTIPDNFIKDKTEIIFKGIDTFSTIWLNGNKLGETDNMFREYSFDISDYLKENQENEIIAKINSIKEKMKDFPEDDYFACFNVPRIFVRKAQCHFGWDWAPDFPATGIWRDIELVSYQEVKIDEVNINTRLNGDISFFTSFSSVEGQFTAENEVYDVLIKIKGSETIEKKFKVTEADDHFTIKIPDPKLWWPQGYGDPYLYDYDLILLKDGIELTRKKGKFGIRKVELLEEPRTDEDGFKFNYIINDTPVFIKGANWVPLDLMTGAIKDKKYENIIKMAADANFNMLRVWGGGIYEKDIFYELCDEKGIMVWQDFMFACADTPDNHSWFVNHIIPEIEYQVKRLRNHPAIVSWCGGNEKTGSYGKLKCYGDFTFHYLIRGICNDLDNTRPYISSSPFSYKSIGNDELSGDTHCNSYQPALQKDINDFREVLYNIKASFSSEIAVQGSSRYQSIAKFIPEDDMWPLNQIWDLHFTENPYDGTDTTFAEQQLQVAEELFGSIDSAGDFIKKSMTTHKEFVEAEAQYHRARKYNCGGAMFWMCSDVWPSGTWALIDYYQLPKPAYYAAKRSFSPVIVSIQEREEGIKAFIINDLMKEIKGDLKIGEKTLKGKIIWEENINNIIVSENTAIEAASFKKHEKNSNSYLFARFSGEEYQLKSVFFPELWKNIKWPQAIINYDVVYSIREDNNWITEIEINTDNYARMVNVNLDQEMLRFDLSDNFFDLEAGDSKIIKIKSDKPVQLENIVIDHWLTDWK